ncbi:aldo/keto reductase [Phlyctema vagabunda]|uniref:Aldo/keto reductase n=1 Tax=Phlyctema vagabunda TaxID=108571 RepID=A0ABR4P8L3_9HELO
MASEQSQSNGSHPIETFQLGPHIVPRVFGGLWQMSSPAWGTAPRSKIIKQFNKHVNAGFTAFDMADHYGDAEVVFGKFRSSRTDPESIFCATKYCIFQPIAITKEVVAANITQRCKRTNGVDLLQFHWQDYSDHQYIQALKYIEQDERVKVVGLCNFDTQRMVEVAEAGIKVVSNQVQFSLIDSRPIFAMDKVCEKYNIKLLTYGTLCGGLIADKWLNEPVPDLYGDNFTPSQRKYFEAINVWGGWDLFQELLQALSLIAAKYKVSISNVATRWVLDFPYVGAVIVGCRMGVSDHSDENTACFGWKLDDQDRAAIDAVLAKSRREDMFKDMGDCGAEYR